MWPSRHLINEKKIQLLLGGLHALDVRAAGGDSNAGRRTQLDDALRRIRLIQSTRYANALADFILKESWNCYKFGGESEDPE